jgi:hypothetical protein
MKGVFFNRGDGRIKMLGLGESIKWGKEQLCEANPE